MWQKANVIPDLGAHAEKYAKFVFAALGQNIRRAQVPRSEIGRHKLFLGLATAFSVLSVDIAEGVGLARTTASLIRVVHEALVLMGRLGYDKAQINAVLAAALDDELARVDPARGLLDDNDGEPYLAGSLILDPPEYKTIWEHGVVKLIESIRVPRRCRDEPDL